MTKAKTTKQAPGHDMPSPFPMKTPLGQYVVDELCTCGMRRSEHHDRWAYGHGPSFDGACPQFTWQGPVVHGSPDRGEA